MPLKSRLSDDGSDFATQAAGQIVLVDDDGLACLVHRVEYSLFVQRVQSAQIDDLNADPLVGQFLGGFLRLVGHQAVSDGCAEDRVALLPDFDLLTSRMPEIHCFRECTVVY